MLENKKNIACVIVKKDIHWFYFKMSWKHDKMFKSLRKSFRSSGELFDDLVPSVYV